MQYDRAYLVGREPLTEEEHFVLGCIKQCTAVKPLGEHEFHMMMSIMQDISKDGPYEFKPKWWEHVDERYVTGMGSVPYSERLHGVVNSLVKKYYLARGVEDPITIFEDRQLRLF